MDSANINPLPIPGMAMFCFTVGSVFNPFGIAYCENNYPQGMGEFSITLNNLIVNECDNQIPITLTTNTCNLLGLRSQLFCQFPHWSIQCHPFCKCSFRQSKCKYRSSPVLNGALDFCNGAATIRYDVNNISSDPSNDAFGLIVTIQHYQWMNINFIDVGM
ncbi:MAG: hypothetical protein R2769_04510 [Saprospiraceae bacterium]